MIYNPSDPKSTYTQFVTIKGKRELHFGKDTSVSRAIGGYDHPCE